MAEKAAHHTKTIINRPSIFEVIAQENLSSTIYPALKKFFNVSFICILNNYIITFYFNIYNSILLIKILDNWNA